MASSIYVKIKNHVDALLSALWYDYTNDCVRTVIEDVKRMIKYNGTRDCTELASYIFKVLVFLYGDYGVVPAVGWIYDENKAYLIKAIDEWCNAYLNVNIYDINNVSILCNRMVK